MRCCARRKGCGADMTTRYLGAPIKRNEDRRLLTGQALFVDDVELPGMLHAAFLRSQVAHARIRRIDVSRGAGSGPAWSRSTPREDLGDYWQPGPLLVPPPPIAGIDLQPAHPGAAGQGQGPPRRRAARDRDRGEPLHRRGRARRHRGRARSAAGGGRSRSGARRRIGARARRRRRATSRPMSTRRKGDYAAARRKPTT